jgi:hypothetical protein
MDIDEMPAINEADLFAVDTILYDEPVKPVKAFVNSFLIIKIVGELPKTTGEPICFLY